MSEMARLLVRETHGIRRFLYPLKATVSLPDGADITQLSLILTAGKTVPLQTSVAGDNLCLNFAVSLAPYEEIKLSLVTDGVIGTIADPLHVTPAEDSCSFQSVQERFQVKVGPDALLQEIIYDGISHLRGPLRIEPSEMDNVIFVESAGGALTASADVYGKQGACHVYTYSEITACKSWVTVAQNRDIKYSGETVTFMLPLAVTSPALTCDFGVGGGIYAKLQQGVAQEVVWLTELLEDGTVHWSVATDGRVDYIGEEATQMDYLAQRWFHVIDNNKALAVAITGIPDECDVVTVTLNTTGDVQIAFRLGRTASSPMTFGICYHFLNDVPAIAAATNPQSILLPPVVEVLPLN